MNWIIDLMEGPSPVAYFSTQGSPKAGLNHSSHGFLLAGSSAKHEKYNTRHLHKDQENYRKSDTA